MGKEGTAPQLQDLCARYTEKDLLNGGVILSETTRREVSQKR